MQRLAARRLGVATQLRWVTQLHTRFRNPRPGHMQRLAARRLGVATQLRWVTQLHSIGSIYVREFPLSFAELLITENLVKAEEAIIQPKDPSGFLKRLVHHYQLHIPAGYDARHGWVQFKRGRLEAEVQGLALHLRITAPNWLGMLVIKRSLNRHVAVRPA